jgi:hypothetical protein
LRSECKDCKPAYRKPTEAQLDRKRAKQRANYRADPQPRLIQMRADQYALDYSVVESLVNGACFICESVEKSLHIDHCHESGKVRGALCFNCNTALGKFKDDAKIVRRAFQYLEADRDYRDRNS